MHRQHARRRMEVSLEEPSVPTSVLITYRHVDASPVLESRIHEHIEILAQCCEDIMGCHVTVALPPGRRRAGVPFEVTVDLSVPGHHIAVHSGGADRLTHVDVYSALRDAFETLRRLLQDYVPYSAMISADATRNPACT